MLLNVNMLDFRGYKEFALSGVKPIKTPHVSFGESLVFCAARNIQGMKFVVCSCLAPSLNNGLKSSSLFS